MRQLCACKRCHRADIIAVIVIGHGLLAAQFFHRKLGRLIARTQRHLGPAPPGTAKGIGKLGHRIAAEDVLIQLHPQPRQAVGRIVGVAHAGGRGDAAPRLIQRRGDLVINLLLPILMPRRSACIAVGIGRGQHFIQLAELVLETALGLLDTLRESRARHDKGEEHKDKSQGESPNMKQYNPREAGSAPSCCGLGA